MSGSMPRHVKARNTKKKSKKTLQGSQGQPDGHELTMSHVLDTIQMPLATSQARDLEVPDNQSSLNPLPGTGVPSNALVANQRQDVAQAHVSQAHSDWTISSGRTFSTAPYAHWFTLADIEVKVDTWTFVACPSSRTKCPCCMQHDNHKGWLITSIAGTCVNNGKDQASARSAIGVYFGPSNRNNIAANLSETRHTSQIAELKACIGALQRAISIWKIATPCKADENCYPMRLLVIKSDSPYIVNGATEWLPKWKENNWKSCKGQKVANHELWRVIDRWIEHLESEISVQFWLVPKEENVIAELMSRSALGKG